MSLNIVIYSKPSCPYCVRAKQLLDSKNVSYQDINVLKEDPQVYEDLKQRTKQRTVPQIFINDYFVGGCDNLFALERSGELDKLLSSQE